MQSKKNQPNAVQKRWREAVRELGSIMSGDPAVIHHCVGATGKHKKVSIGHEFILPLTDQEHKDLHNRGEFNGASRKEFEKFYFSRVIMRLMDHPNRPEDHVIEAIMDYHL